MKIYQRLILRNILIITLTFSLNLLVSAQDKSITIKGEKAGTVGFAVSEITKEAIHRGYVVTSKTGAFFRITFISDSLKSVSVLSKYNFKPLQFCGAETYSIRVSQSRSGKEIFILASSPEGAMYGGLDIAEAFRLGTVETVGDSDHKPCIVNRGIKFNIPLDLRSPSYSDNGDAAQNNIPDMWDYGFWTAFLDDMARYRYNHLSLWNLDPFPSMVKVPEYPDVALSDVWRTKEKLDENFDAAGTDLMKPSMLANHEVVKKITIEEKIKFWQKVMRYGKDRGIEFYLFTWNIFTFGAQGKYGITPNQSNDTTIAYLRASVRETIKTYPLLKGIGITANEYMKNVGKYSNAEWIWKTYGEGTNDALKELPGREFRLIKRFGIPEAEFESTFKNLMCPIEPSFKYSMAHMYSMHNPTFINSMLPGMKAGTKTWLTVRNDDIYSFVWGDPDYARDYIKAMPPSDKITGFYMGPDGYVWGRDYIDKERENPPRMVIEKQWYSFMLWGRLSYDPDLKDDFFADVLKVRYPDVPADKLFQAFQESSKVLPEITRFFWGKYDVNWFPEACMRRKSAFITVKDFMTNPTMPGSIDISISDWREKFLAGLPLDGKTPLEVAESLHLHASKSSALYNQLKEFKTDDIGLKYSIGDFEAYARLGNYYSEKITGAAKLALYDATGIELYRSEAIEHLEKALNYWKQYSEIYTSQYVQPLMYCRVFWVDIPGFIKDAEKDIEIAKNWKWGTLK